MGTRLAPLAYTAVLVLAACGSGDDDAGSATSATAAATTTAAAPSTTSAPTATPAPTTAPVTTAPNTTAPVTTAPAATVPEPVDAPWTALTLDDCKCSDGSAVTFFERIADPTKVVLFFEGGGACFSAETCDPDSPNPIFTHNQNGVTARTLERARGYFDFTNPENPLAGYSWIYVPYCTGDVHIGDTTHDYGDGVVIEHRGHNNAMKALDHLAEQFPDVQQLVVTGQSAGSVPTPQFAALAADLLPDADIVTFGDSSGAYPDVDGINALIGGVWGTADAIPDWPETEGIGVEDWSFPEQYIYAGRHAPGIRFGRFDFAFDEVQATFGALAGVAADDLVSLIDANEAAIESGGVDLATFVAPGSTHTISGSDELYTLEVNGVRLIDWLTELLTAPQPPPDVHCEECQG
jgi:hypothetical protein